MDLSEEGEVWRRGVGRRGHEKGGGKRKEEYRMDKIGIEIEGLKN